MSRDQIFAQLQAVVAGEPARVVWPAAGDLIAWIVCVAAQDRASAERLLDELRRGVLASVDHNWERVRAETPALTVRGRA